MHAYIHFTGVHQRIVLLFFWILAQNVGAFTSANIKNALQLEVTIRACIVSIAIHYYY
jgi:hypothetical protein